MSYFLSVSQNYIANNLRKHIINVSTVDIHTINQTSKKDIKRHLFFEYFKTKHITYDKIRSKPEIEARYGEIYNASKNYRPSIGLLTPSLLLYSTLINPKSDYGFKNSIHKDSVPSVKTTLNNLIYKIQENSNLKLTDICKYSQELHLCPVTNSIKGNQGSDIIKQMPKRFEFISDVKPELNTNKVDVPKADYITNQIFASDLREIDFATPERPTTVEQLSQDRSVWTPNEPDIFQGYINQSTLKRNLISPLLLHVPGNASIFDIKINFAQENTVKINLNSGKDASDLKANTKNLQFEKAFVFDERMSLNLRHIWRQKIQFPSPYSNFEVHFSTVRSKLVTDQSSIPIYQNIKNIKQFENVSYELEIEWNSSSLLLIGQNEHKNKIIKEDCKCMEDLLLYISEQLPSNIFHIPSQKTSLYQ